MEKIKIGEWARTTDGFIFKVNKKKYSKEYKDYWYSEGFLKGAWGESIVKHRKNLMSLIQVGDLVNGHIVTKKYEISVSYGDDLCVFNIGEDCFLNRTIFEEEIETILTKERYEANCCKVGGKDESTR